MSSRSVEIGITADATQAIEEVRTLRREVERLQEEMASVRSPSVRILREPLTYDARLVRDGFAKSGFRVLSTHENRSYVKDFVLSQMKGDLEARERLDQHSREMRIVSQERDRLFHPDIRAEFEQRAVNWAAGTGGYFAPPLWIIEQFARQPTPYRVLGKLSPQFELPEGAQSVNLPAWSAGAEVGPQQLGTAAANTATTDSAISSAVCTIAGNYDVPMQMLEQSPQGAHLDWVAFSVMEARYDYQLELQLLVGSGSSVPQGSGNNQLLGLFNNTAIPAANQVSYTGPAEGTASAATSMFSSFGLAIAKVGQARLVKPEAWLMSTSRGAWLGSSEDTQSRPLMIADNPNTVGEWDLLGYPVFLDDAIPRTLGSGMNEDRVIACRPSDWLILESDRRTSVNSLKQDSSSVRGRDNAQLGDAMGQVLSGTLMVRLQMRRYVAALLRYPSSVAWLQGSGMATGGGF